MGEEQLRCKDCQGCKQYPEAAYCLSPAVPDPGKEVNPGQFACGWFIYKDK